MNNLVLAVISFLIILGPLVIIHELGHFIAAKLVGITVLEFGIGFPPRARVLFEWKGTKFTLNWLPIGGFVLPLGEDYVKPVGAEATERDRKAYEEQQGELARLSEKQIKTKSVFEAKPLEKILFMVAGATANLIAAFVILVIVAMLGRPVLDSATVTVLEVAANSPAQKAGIQSGDVITQINGKPVKLAKDVKASMESLDARKATGLDVTFKHGDKEQTVNLIYSKGDFSTSAKGVLIIGISKGSPAENVLKEGDRITYVDKTPIVNNTDLQNYVKQNAGKLVTLTLIRDGKEQKVELTPRENPPPDQGRIGINIGDSTTISNTIDPGFGMLAADTTTDTKPATYVTQRVSFAEAVPLAWSQYTAIINRIASFPVMLVRGVLTPQEARPVSIVGISQAGAQILQESLEVGEAYPILNFAALISIALAITNLLPIPALDGGRILFVLVEILRGKPMEPEWEGKVHFVGLVVLLALSALLIVNDILNPIILPTLR